MFFIELPGKFSPHRIVYWRDQEAFKNIIPRSVRKPHFRALTTRCISPFRSTSACHVLLRTIVASSLF